MHVAKPGFTAYSTLLYAVLTALSGCAATHVYNVRGIEGDVMDRATRQPLEGVTVVEVWEVYQPGWHGSTAGYLPLREAVSDSQGHYSFAPRGTMHIEAGYLDESAPWLIFFKPGYVFTSEMNRFHPDRRFEFVRKSDWDGKAIELDRFQGTLDQYAAELERFGSVLGNLKRGDWCEWMGIPRTLSVLRRELVQLQAAGVRARVAIGAPWVLEELRKCPSSNLFFEAYEE